MSCNWSSTTSYDNVTNCSGLDMDNRELADLERRLELTRFFVQRVLAPVIIFPGIIANILTIIVLTRRSMTRSSTNVYLSALAVYDAIYLALAFSMSWKHYESLQSMPWFVRYRKPFGKPLIDSASNTAVWLVVTFTVERFIGVRFPMKGKVWCTPRRAVYVVIIICTSAFLITFPEFFECRIVVEQSSSASNRSNYSSADTQQVILRPVPTEFGASVGYRLGYSYVNQSLFTFLPLILLFIFNSLLVKAVLSAARLRKAMTSANVRESTRTADRELTEQRITVMLITVVVVFLVCQLPQSILNLYSEYLRSTPGALTSARVLKLQIGGNICNLLVVINSAVNFVLYSAISVKFRQTFQRTFCCCRSSDRISATTAAPLTRNNENDERRSRRTRIVLSELGDQHETVGTSGPNQTLLDGVVS